LLAAHSHATPKQAKEPSIPNQTMKTLSKNSQNVWELLLLLTRNIKENAVFSL
jgi:hypothetical protein